MTLAVSSGLTGKDSHTIKKPTDAELIPRGRLLPFLVVTPLFFIWAIPNNLTDFLIRQFMKSFEINRSGAAQLQIAIFVGYFLLAIPAGQIMRRFGYKVGLMTGLLLMACGCWLFWPAAVFDSYAFFIAAQFVIGSGLSFLETGANSFIAQLGPAASSERRLNLSQAFNPLGSISAGLVGTFFIFSGIEHSASQTSTLRDAGTLQAYLHSETMRVVPTYLILGGLAFLWALMILVTRFPALIGEDLSESAPGAGGMRVRLFQRHFVLAVIAQFLYVGAQVGTWSYFILYVKSATNMGEKPAGYMLTGTLAAFAIGRFSSAWLMRRFDARAMLGIYAAINVVLGLAAVFWFGWVGMYCLLTTSLFMSMMFPTIFALGLKGMGEKTKTAGSLLVMAILGGAAFTKLMGELADRHSLQAAYAVPVACFAFVALYAWFWAEEPATD
jgi:MFS transporter, FHS family, L-fucose permease